MRTLPPRIAVDYAGPPAHSRWFALLLIVALHIVGVWAWPQRHAAPAGAAQTRGMAITFVRIAAAPRLPAGPAASAVAPPRRVRAHAAPPQSQRFVAPLAAPVVPVPATIQKSADEIIGQARRDVGKIDRALRAASLDMDQRHLVINPTLRERLLAGAFIERGPPKMIEEVMNDGSRRTRIGNHCAAKESNGLVGARDVFRDGIRTVWKPC